MSRRLLPLVLTAAVALAVAVSALTAGAAPATQQTLPPGTVITLSGTPHLWIADEQGVLHWGGDTRALANRNINWADQRPVNLQQLLSFQRGDPWLSAGLLKLGEPIYLVKWETNQTAPTLLHIQSIADVETFGINANNYGTFVMDRAAWEQRFGFNVDTLQRGELQPATQPAATPTTAAAAPTATAATTGKLEAKLASREYSGDTPATYRVKTTLEVTGAPPRTLVRVSLAGRQYDCSPNCNDTKPISWGPIEAGTANADGYVKFEDTHSVYESYTYTFTAANGQTAAVRLDSDFTVIS
jgi:hypothetical protein